MKKSSRIQLGASLVLATFLITLLWNVRPAKYDATNETTIRESTREIIDSLPENQHEEFELAVRYFSVGGYDGWETMMLAALSGESTELTGEAMETKFFTNLQSIHGLTGDEILAKYQKAKAKHEKEMAEQEKVNSLQKEAQNLLASNQFEEALNRYNEMSEISSGVEAAKQGIAHTTKSMEDFAEKMSYMEKVQITEFRAQRIDTSLKEGVPAVRISLKNIGDRSLDMVEVIVYFKDKDDQIIFEEDLHPVIVSEYSSSTKPLKPGYVQEMEEGRYYIIESQLSEWAEGEATAKVTDIRFSE